MSDDDTVTIELEVSADRLDAMRRVRNNQRRGRRRTGSDLDPESPSRVIAKLLMEAYRADLRRAENRQSDSLPGEQWM